MSRHLIALFIVALAGYSTDGFSASAPSSQPPPDLDFDFILIDRSGAVEVLGPVPAGGYSPRVSPDGRQLVIDSPAGTWIADLSDVAAARLLVPGKAQWPFFSPDGKSVLYTGEVDGQQTVFRQALDGSAPATLLIRPARAVESWSPQHDVISYIELASEGDYGIWAYALQDGKRSLLINSAPTAQNSSQFSPDGTLISYASNESGRFEVYLQRYPQGGEPIRVTQDGGHHPVWSADGKELLFDRDGREFFAVSVENGPSIKVGTPRSFPVPAFVQTPLRRQFDMTPEGRILMLAPRKASQ